MRIREGIITNTIDIDIPFYDVDSAKITWHGNYIKYLEVARCALLSKIGYDYVQMAESGYFWPVVDLRVKYVKPSVFKQKISIETSIIEYENRLKIQYVIFDKQSHERLTKAYTTQVAVDATSQEMCLASPQILIAKVNAQKSS